MRKSNGIADSHIFLLTISISDHKMEISRDWKFKHADFKLSNRYCCSEFRKNKVEQTQGTVTQYSFPHLENIQIATTLQNLNLDYSNLFFAQTILKALWKFLTFIILPINYLIPTISWVTLNIFSLQLKYLAMCLDLYVIQMKLNLKTNLCVWCFLNTITQIYLMLKSFRNDLNWIDLTSCFAVWAIDLVSYCKTCNIHI